MTTLKEIEIAEQIMEQLRQEGAVDQVIDHAKGLTDRQFKDARHDFSAVVQLLGEAFAASIAQATTRPKCCRAHQDQFLIAILAEVTRLFREEVKRLDEGGEADGPKPH